MGLYDSTPVVTAEAVDPSQQSTYWPAGTQGTMGPNGYTPTLSPAQLATLQKYGANPIPNDKGGDTDIRSNPYFQQGFNGNGLIDDSTAEHTHLGILGAQAAIDIQNPAAAALRKSTVAQNQSLTPRYLPNGEPNPSYDSGLTPDAIQKANALLASYAAKGNGAFENDPKISNLQNALSSAQSAQAQIATLQNQYATLAQQRKYAKSSMAADQISSDMQDLADKINSPQLTQFGTPQDYQAKIQQAQQAQDITRQQQIKQAQYYAGPAQANFSPQQNALAAGFSQDQLNVGKGIGDQIKRGLTAVASLDQMGVTDPAKRNAFTQAVAGKSENDIYELDRQQKLALYNQQQAPVKLLMPEIANGKLLQDPNMGNAWYRLVPDPNTPTIQDKTMGGEPKMVKQYLDPAMHPIAAQAFQQATNGANPMPVQSLSDSDKATVADIIQKKNLPPGSNPYEVLKAARDAEQQRLAKSQQPQQVTDWTKNIVLAPAEGGVELENLAKYTAKGILNAPINALNAATGTEAITPFAQGNAITPTPQQWGTLNSGYQQLKQGVGNAVSSGQGELRYLLGVKTPEEKVRLQQLLSTLK